MHRPHSLFVSLTRQYAFLFICGVSGLSAVHCGDSHQDPQVTTTAPTLPQIEDLVAEDNVVPPTDWGEGIVELQLPEASGNMSLVYEGFAGEEPAITSGLFADLDQNGRPEVVLSSEGCCSSDERVQVWSFNPDGSGWEFREGLAEALSTDAQALVGLQDMDGDGQLDAIYSDPFGLVRWGEGNGTFSPRQLDMSGDTLVTYGFVQTVDLNRDGLLDLLVGHHTCQGEQSTVIPILQEGRRRWQLAPGFLPAGLKNGNFYAAMMFPSFMGPSTLYLTGRNCLKSEPYEPFLAEVGRDADGTVVWEEVDPTPADAAYKDTVNIGFGPISNGDPMGATLSDLNGDGWMDFVTTLDFRNLLLRGTPDGIWEDISLGSGLQGAYMDEEAAGWGVAATDMDADGRDDLLVVNGPFRTAQQPTVAPISLYWNGGDFQFRRVSIEVGLNAEASWRGLAVNDLDGDGDPDFVASGVGMAPRVFQNQLSTEGKAVAIQLKGSLSTAHGTGAMVTLLGDEEHPPQGKMMGHIGSPNTQGPPALFFAMAPGRSSGTFQIVWPSGLTSTETITGAGAYVFTEPEVVKIEPRSRILMADGESQGRLVITPPDEGAQVTLLRRGDEGMEEVSLSSSGGTFDYVWTASLTPRKWVFEIIIDGESLKILPLVVEVELGEKKD